MAASAAVLSGIFFFFCRTVDPIFFYIPPGTVREAYKRNPDVFITVYPHRFSNPAGSVIFIHGGGWRMGGSEMPFYSDWEELLANAKLKAFSIEHRTSPQFHGMDIVNDCMDAVRYINKNAARFGIPANHFALVGFSSGGHLSLMSALRFNNNDKENIKISSVVAYYSPLELRLLYRNGNPTVKRILEGFAPASSLSDENSLLDALEGLSPYHNIHERMPYVLLIHGMEDDLVSWNQSNLFYEKSKALKPGRAEMILLKKGGHNFNTERNQETLRVERRAVRFIQKRI